MRSLAIIAITLATLSASAQTTPSPSEWNLGGTQQVNALITSLPAEDQQGIERALSQPPANLRAVRINTPSGHLFLVQVSGNTFCGASGNCTAWVLSSDYKIVLKTIAQGFKVETPLHAGQPDIMTTMHGSATSGNLQQWRFDGVKYNQVACASYSYTNSFGDTLRSPHITPYSCASR